MEFQAICGVKLITQGKQQRYSKDCWYKSNLDLSMVIQCRKFWLFNFFNVVERRNCHVRRIIWYIYWDAELGCNCLCIGNGRILYSPIFDRQARKWEVTFPFIFIEVTCSNCCNPWTFPALLTFPASWECEDNPPASRAGIVLRAFPLPQRYQKHCPKSCPRQPCHG